MEQLPNLDTVNETVADTGTAASTPSGNGIIEFGQETISIIVIVGVCVLLGVLNVVIWLCGCQKHARRNEEEKQDRQYERDRFNDKRHHQDTPHNKKKKVADKPILIKKADTAHVENELQDRHLASKINSTETIEEFESRVREQFSHQNVLENIREERSADHPTPAKNPRVGNIASETGSSETLQRNDSKVNVFNADKLEEVDLNPALNNTINLETI